MILNRAVRDDTPAGVRDRNRLVLSHWSRGLPLNDSMNGLPGSALGYQPTTGYAAACTL